MTKLEAQLKDLKKAFTRLEEAVGLPSKIIINQDATIQRFEFTFEICWKIMQTIVNQNKLDVYGPKNVFREAAKLGIIDDPNSWFDFLNDRNLTVHTFKEKIARKVYKSAKEFVPFVKKLISSVEEYLKK